MTESIINELADWFGKNMWRNAIITGIMLWVGIICLGGWLL